MTKGRGVRIMREKGEGFTGTSMKDTWIKTRGGVETGEGCGEGWDGGKRQKTT